MDIIPRRLKDTAFMVSPNLVAEYYKNHYKKRFKDTKVYMNVLPTDSNFDIRIGKHSESVGIINVNKPLDITSGKKYKIYIGNYTVIGTDVTILSSVSHITSGVAINMHALNYALKSEKHGRDLFNSNYKEQYGDVIIGNDVQISKDVTIRGGVTIGDSAVIGTKALVTHDVEPYSIVAGIPAKKLRYKFPKKMRDTLLAIKWWDWPDKKVEDNIDLFYNPKEFCKKFAPAKTPTTKKM